MLSVRDRSGAVVFCCRGAGVVVLCLTVLCVTPGCATATGQTDLSSSAVAGQVLDVLAQAVQQQLKAVVDRLQSRLETLDSRLTLLDARVDEITIHLLRKAEAQPLDDARLEVSLRQDEAASTVDQLVSRLDSLTARLDSHESRLEDLSRLDSLTARLDSHESRLEDLSRLDSLTARLDSHESRLEDLSGRCLSEHVAHTSRLNETSNTTSNETSNETPNEASNATTSRPTDASQPSAQSQTYPRDCSDLPPGSPSGIYLLHPSRNDSQSPPVQSRCDMDTDGGNWTVIQNRAHDIQPEQDFNLGWKEYKRGFGNVTGEFWWGLDNMWQLTSSPDRKYELRVDLEAFGGERAYAVYHNFGVSSELDGYRLRGSFAGGPAGHSMRFIIGERFSTRDKDQDKKDGASCTDWYRVGWWFGSCSMSNPNGRRLQQPSASSDTTWDKTRIMWLTWKRAEALKGARMMVRPVA